MSDILLSDATQSDLKIIVERAVRPVQAILTRKLALREELLGHVTAVFDEELARTGDRSAALAETARRFGDPQDVAAGLQKAVPGHERPYVWVERFTERRPGDSNLRRATRIAVLISAITAGAIAVGVLPQVTWNDAPFAIAMRMIGAAAVGSAAMTFGFVLLGTVLRRARFDRPETRSAIQTAGVALAASLLPLAVLSILAFVALGSVPDSIDFVQRQILHGPLIPLLFLSPLVLFLAVWQIAKERRYIATWTELSLD